MTISREFVYVLNYRLKIPIVNHIYFPFVPTVPTAPMDRLFEHVYPCSVGGHETKIYITDVVFISPSVRTDNISLPTVNCLYHRYRQYRWTSFSTATSCPWNNANYQFYQRIFNVYRWCIQFSIGTDGQHRFTNGKFPLPSVPSVPMDKLFEATSCPCSNAN